MNSPTNGLVVYTSTFGNTRLMAEATANGAQSVQGAQRGSGCDASRCSELRRVASWFTSTASHTSQSWQHLLRMHWGPQGHSGGPRTEAIGVTEDMLLAAWHHGANVARVATELKGKQLFATDDIDPAPEMLAAIQASEHDFKRP